MPRRHSPDTWVPKPPPRRLRLEKATGERRLTLSEEQIRLLERFSPEFRERHIEAPRSGALVAVDTFFVGTLKGEGSVSPQTAIGCHSRYAWARLYPNKSPVTAVQLLNKTSCPPSRPQGRGRGGAARQWPGVLRTGRSASYRLFLQLEGIDHRCIQAKRPQTNGVVVRLHRTLLDEHFRSEGRRTWFETVDEMQASLKGPASGIQNRHQAPTSTREKPTNCSRPKIQPAAA